MAESKIVVPADGGKIHIDNGKLVVPDNPIIPFIEGDGTGRDIWRASVRVMDAAVEIAMPMYPISGNGNMPKTSAKSPASRVNRAGRGGGCRGTPASFSEASQRLRCAWGPNNLGWIKVSS